MPEMEGPLVVRGDIAIKPSASGKDGTLRVGNPGVKLVVDGNIFSVGQIDAHVFGPVICESLVTQDGDVKVRGDIEVSGRNAPFTRGDIRVNGNITTLGDVEAGNALRVNGSITTFSDVNAGNVRVSGDVVLANADCAEEFDVDKTCVQQVTAGTVVVLGDRDCIRQSTAAYDKRVAGVVSGGADYKPGIILDKRTTNTDRSAVALMGKVFCKVDATYSAIEIGDLLTTSDTPGHAMKATDPTRAFGAVIGKALRPLREGKVPVPVLVALQ